MSNIISKKTITTLTGKASTGKAKNTKTIGILGGTFDPIHFGHLRAALDIKQRLALDELRIIPCKNPPNGKSPLANASHRLQMVKLALENTELMLDDREMKREGDGFSYTIDTLLSLKKEFPNNTLCLILGVDAFLELPTWHRWEELLHLANIVVMHRTGFSLPVKGIMDDFLKKHALKAQDLKDAQQQIREVSAGKIIEIAITSLDIQASQLRKMIQSGISPQFLLAEKTLDYIQKQGLYGYNGENFENQTEEAIHR